jgi:hypothetical protein
MADTARCTEGDIGPNHACQSHDCLTGDFCSHRHGSQGYDCCSPLVFAQAKDSCRIKAKQFHINDKPEEGCETICLSIGIPNNIGAEKLHSELSATGHSLDVQGGGFFHTSGTTTKSIFLSTRRSSSSVHSSSAEPAINAKASSTPL